MRSYFNVFFGMLIELASILYNPTVFQLNIDKKQWRYASQTDKKYIFTFEENDSAILLSIFKTT